MWFYHEENGFEYEPYECKERNWLKAITEAKAGLDGG